MEQIKNIFSSSFHEVETIKKDTHKIYSEYLNISSHSNPNEDTIRRLKNSATLCANVSVNDFANRCVSVCKNDSPMVHIAGKSFNWFTPDMYAIISGWVKSSQQGTSNKEHRTTIKDNLKFAIEKKYGMKIKHIIITSWKDIKSTISKDGIIRTPSTIAFVLQNRVDMSHTSTIILSKNDMKRIYADVFDVHYYFSLSSSIFRAIGAESKMFDADRTKAILSHLIHNKIVTNLGADAIITRDIIKDITVSVLGGDSDDSKKKVKSSTIFKRGDWTIKNTIDRLERLSIISILNPNENVKHGKKYRISENVKSVYELIELFESGTHTTTQQAMVDDVLDCLSKTTTIEETVEIQPMVCESESVSSPSEIKPAELTDLIVSSFVFEKALYDEFDDIDPYTLEPMVYECNTCDEEFDDTPVTIEPMVYECNTCDDYCEEEIDDTPVTIEPMVSQEILEKVEMMPITDNTYRGDAMFSKLHDDFVNAKYTMSDMQTKILNMRISEENTSKKKDIRDNTLSASQQNDIDITNDIQMMIRAMNKRDNNLQVTKVAPVAPVVPVVPKVIVADIDADIDAQRQAILEKHFKHTTNTVNTPKIESTVEKTDELSEPSFDGYTVSRVNAMNLQQLIEFNKTVLKVAQVRANSNGDDRLSKNEITILMKLSKVYKSRKNMFVERISTTTTPTDTFPAPKTQIIRYTQSPSLNFSPEQEIRLAKEYQE